MACADINADELEYYDYGEEEDQAVGDAAHDEASLESDSPGSPPPIPDIVCDRFRVDCEIGSGSYSEVFSGVDSSSGDKVAIKVEWEHAEKGDKLLAEAKLMCDKLEGGSNGAAGMMPKVHWSGTEGEYNLMVMDLLGVCVEDLRKKREKFSVETTAFLAWQIVDRLRYVHSRGVLYRDIKPHNFVMGRGTQNKRVYIVDFGLAKMYRDHCTGCHIPCTKKRGLTGTVRYSSSNVHAGIEASRRDDLESVGYMLLHFLRGSLPWQGLKNPKGSCKKTKHERIRQCKLQTTDEELCAGFPTEFVMFFKHCRGLKFDEEPNYSHLQQLMADILTKKGCSSDSPSFDWNTDATKGHEDIFPAAKENKTSRDRRSRGNTDERRRSRSRSRRG